jgi:hypothetical protein
MTQGRKTSLTDVQVTINLHLLTRQETKHSQAIINRNGNDLVLGEVQESQRVKVCTASNTVTSTVELYDDWQVACIGRIPWRRDGHIQAIFANLNLLSIFDLLDASNNGLWANSLVLNLCVGNTRLVDRWLRFPPSIIA